MSRSVTLVSTVGARHKNTVARTVAARILAETTEALGVKRLFARKERSVLQVLIRCGAELLLDGSLDTR